MNLEHRKFTILQCSNRIYYYKDTLAKRKATRIFIFLNLLTLLYYISILRYFRNSYLRNIVSWYVSLNNNNSLNNSKLKKINFQCLLSILVTMAY